MWSLHTTLFVVCVLACPACAFVSRVVALVLWRTFYTCCSASSRTNDTIAASQERSSAPRLLRTQMGPQSSVILLSWHTFCSHRRTGPFLSQPPSRHASGGPASLLCTCSCQRG